MARRTIVVSGLVLVLLACVASAQERKGSGTGRMGGFGMGGLGMAGLGMGGAGGMQITGAILLPIAEVQKELGLSERQKSDVEGLLKETWEQARKSFGQINFQDFQKMSQEERERRFAEMQKKVEETSRQTDEKVARILDAKQMERLNQLLLQRQGVGAINREEIARRLGLSEGQREKIKKIQEEAMAQARAAMQNLSQEERRNFFSRMQDQRKKTEKEIMDVLNDDQVMQWGEMCGKEFKFPQPQFGGFGRGAAGGAGGERRRPATRDEDR